ncbi:hypothetical protein [Agromyces atrinae]|uniref:HK97 gp10 family phage protein n=1 Tax=Agromyces atrinae TaxID=592376 RepID=A0A4Q2M503_9MICO|nr:hypothetical protein [Agromyces atrinae]NYD65985.1 hypothetical protein [Agromyces atrinae]RXZ86317.1 hypothetical protein ESP50_11205 [Agromyces atrinae]
MLSIDARASREIQATLFAIKLAAKDVRKQIRVHTKAMIGPEWAKAVNEAAKSPLDKRIARTSTVAVADRGVTLRMGTKGFLKNSTRIDEIVKENEFGASREGESTYRSRRGSARFEVTRHTQRQLPPKYRKGRVAYPSAARLIPRLASLWVQTTVRTFHDAIEGAS